jgi:MYXO-CTERM domain-containing protein
VQDLLVTADFNGSAGASPALVSAVSGATGQTMWTNGTTASLGGSGLDFESRLGPASDDADEVSGNDAPGLGPIAALGALVLVGFARRRRADRP